MHLNRVISEIETVDSVTILAVLHNVIRGEVSVVEVLVAIRAQLEPGL